MDSVIQLDHVSKKYRLGEQEVTALDDLSLSFRSGEWASVTGPSGAGKSTLLHLIGCLDSPTSGEVILDSRRVSSLSDEELALMRKKKIGFVFQFFNLLPTLTAEENIALPLVLLGLDRDQVQPKVNLFLELIGLAGRRHHRPRQLSGGELQRVAVARAMIHDPLVVLADEPTGNLDTSNGERVIGLLKGLSRRTGSSVILATHSPRLAEVGECMIVLKDGKLESCTRRVVRS